MYFQFLKKLKAKILENYYDKMMVIEKIKGIIKKEKLDHIKHVFHTTEASIAKHLSIEIRPYIIMY